MKSKEELNTIKEEVETVSKKLKELTDEELAQVASVIKVFVENEDNSALDFINWFFKIIK